MKKVLVTGATGFIGNYVIQELLKRNYDVIATSASLEKAQTFLWYNKVKYIPFRLQDIDNAIDYYKFFQSPDVLIHLAWEGLPNYKSAFHIEENLPRQLKLLDNLINNGLRDLSVTGTCFEYGMQEGCLSEDMDALPANPYAIAKNTLRQKLQDLALKKNISFKWIRLFYMYGKGQSPNSLLSQLDKAIAEGQEVFNMSGGEQQRDYLPVEKMVEYIVNIALQDKVTGVINCCSGKPTRVKDLVENYLAAINKNIKLNLGYYPYPDYEPMYFWGDNTKLKKINSF